MKKLKTTAKTLLSLIARDRASELQARIEQGLSPDHRIKVAGRYKPMTLLEYASEKGAAGVAARLIKAGASLNDGYFTPLSMAVLFGRLKVVKLLLESGADPNVRHSDPPHERNRTPLMTAADTGNARIFDLLMDHGADPKAVTSKGVSALTHAVGRGNHHAIERLVKAGCRASSTDLYRPVYDGDLALARLLIRAGADVNVAAKDRLGRTALAAIQGEPEPGEMDTTVEEGRDEAEAEPWRRQRFRMIALLQRHTKHNQQDRPFRVESLLRRV